MLCTLPQEQLMGAGGGGGSGTSSLPQFSSAVLTMAFLPMTWQLGLSLC